MRRGRIATLGALGNDYATSFTRMTHRIGHMFIVASLLHPVLLCKQRLLVGCRRRLGALRLGGGGEGGAFRAVVRGGLRIRRGVHDVFNVSQSG